MLTLGLQILIFFIRKRVQVDVNWFSYFRLDMF